MAVLWRTELFMVSISRGIGHTRSQSAKEAVIEIAPSCTIGFAV
jgi:hypothetical protein